MVLCTIYRCTWSSPRFEWWRVRRVWVVFIVWQHISGAWNYSKHTIVDLILPWHILRCIEWVCKCLLTSNEHLAIPWREQVASNEMLMMSALFKLPNALNPIFIVLAHLNIIIQQSTDRNVAPLEQISCFRTSQALFFLLNAAMCSAEKQHINFIVFGLTPSGLELTSNLHK